MESSKQIETRAAEWLARRDSGEWNAADQARLTAWLDANTLHRVAFLRLEAGWEEASRLKALGAGFARGDVPSVEALTADAGESSARLNKRAGWKPLATAAVLAAAVGGALFVAGPLTTQRYATPIGGVSLVPLEDGSKITLNTDSSVRVLIDDSRRLIELTHGEAFFEVAKDATRPFIVKAGKKRVVAVGTKFSVRRDEDKHNEVLVVVTEGAVRLQGPDTAGEGSAPTVPPLLTAGAVARALDAGVTVQNRTVPEVEEFLSWRSGYVVFHETALTDAIAEFNRYNARKILIQDPAVASMRLTGKFRSTNYETFVRLLEDTFAIEAHRTDDRIVLTAR